MTQNAIYSGGGLVVENGDDIFIPIDPGQLKPTQKPCKITVTLNAVYYGGDNVGSDWKYVISVNGHTWLRDFHTFNWNTWDPVGQKVYEEVLENSCGLTHVLSFFIRARERDPFIFDDVGERVDLMAIRCEEEKSARRLITPVHVPEISSFRWMRKLLKRFPRTALLIFIFDIEAQCV